MTSAAFAAWRARLGISKSETARRLGLSRNSVIAYEAGTVRVPLYISIACAAVELGVKPIE